MKLESVCNCFETEKGRPNKCLNVRRKGSPNDEMGKKMGASVPKKNKPLLSLSSLSVL